MTTAFEEWTVSWMMNDLEVGTLGRHVPRGVIDHTGSEIEVEAVSGSTTVFMSDPVVRHEKSGEALSSV